MTDVLWWILVQPFLTKYSGDTFDWVKVKGGSLIVAQVGLNMGEYDRSNLDF